MLRYLIGLLLAIVLAAVPSVPAPVHAQDDTGWLLAQVNGLRSSVGLHTYALNGQLSAAAAAHSNYMASTCHFSHTEADGSTPQSRAAAQGYAGSWISENIYGGPRAQASDAWNFWINSGVHYEGLTHGRATEVGIGIARGVCGQAFTMLFGQPRGGAAPPPPAPAEGGQPAAVAQAPQPAPPTPRPYVPPPPTNTPTPLIPTLTPSATWTITPTRTPTATASSEPPTGTPLILPTVPALGEQTASPAVVALLASPTTVDTALPSATAQPPTPAPTPAPLLAAVPDDGIAMRDLLPFALLGQAIVIGLVGLAYFRRVR